MQIQLCVSVSTFIVTATACDADTQVGAAKEATGAAKYTDTDGDKKPAIAQDTATVTKAVTPRDTETAADTT